jgi:hypothetical protein
VSNTDNKRQKERVKMLDKREKASVVFQAGLQALPYVGGSLSTLLFGFKQEVRLKRIETFYEDVKSKLEQIESEVPPISQHNSEELMSLIEQLNDCIEVEHLEEKREFYKNYFIRILRSPVRRDNYDLRKLYLDILKTLTLTQLIIFQFLIEQGKPIIDKSIVIHGTSPALILGSIEQLKMQGIVDSRLNGIQIGYQSEITSHISVSQLGAAFHRFCMSDRLS